MFWLRLLDLAYFCKNLQLYIFCLIIWCNDNISSQIYDIFDMPVSHNCGHFVVNDKMFSVDSSNN